MKKQYYFLVTGTVMFATTEGETGQVMINAIVTNKDRLFPSRLIGKAQQAIQLHFFKKINDATVTVLDVPIQNIVNLGLMTEAEFHAAPEGTALQERSTPVENPFDNKVL